MIDLIVFCSEMQGMIYLSAHACNESMLPLGGAIHFLFEKDIPVKMTQSAECRKSEVVFSK